MSNGTLPNYLKMAKPVPAEARTPWYKSTAPSYAGIFLWIVFYKQIASGTLNQSGLGLSLLALVVAGLLCHFLYYLVPGLFGVKTGYPLYVIGSATYGTKGGFVLPALLMGLLQFGWLGVNIAVSTEFILRAARVENLSTGTPAFIIVAILWGLAAGLVGLKGIQYLGKVATYLPIVPLLMLLIVFFRNVGSAGSYQPPPGGNSMAGFLMMIGMVVGFFATAGAAGVDFGMGNRDEKDVKLGGLVGIALAVIVTGGLAIIGVAGANAADPGMQVYDFADIITLQGGLLAGSMFILFAVASFAPAGFSSFIAANSIATLFPKANKTSVVMAGVIVSIILAISGLTGQLVRYFGIIGASFGPICGAMAADYLLSGRKWAGPRKGINWAGYISWAVGFVVAILPMINAEKFGFISPAPVIAFIIGFVLYAILAKAGLEPEVLEMSVAAAAPEAPGQKDVQVS